MRNNNAPPLVAIAAAIAIAGLAATSSAAEMKTNDKATPTMATAIDFPVASAQLIHPETTGGAPDVVQPSTEHVALSEAGVSAVTQNIVTGTEIATAAKTKAGAGNSYLMMTNDATTTATATPPTGGSLLPTHEAPTTAFNSKDGHLEGSHPCTKVACFDNTMAKNATGAGPNVV